ncbi:hypothetical protein G6L30_17245 [Agrobacterium rhizogenes]|nr:hypothetical protein [Rhizobium rhizogenes]
MTQIYTAFCLHTDGRGTTWISCVEASSVEEAQETAKAACADDWGCERQEIHVLGIAQGDINILHWQDYC